MKRLFLIAMLIASLVSCQESKENAGKELPKLYNKRIGEQIPYEVAVRWVENFNTISMAGRTSSTYSLDAAMLGSLINPVAERLGVVLHHGLDEDGQYHLMMYAVDNNAELFNHDVLDIASGQILAKKTAEAWAARYADAHPATPWYHFFGSDVFGEIQANALFDYMNIVRGLNDDNKEQVLLFVYNSSGVENGRNAGEDVTVYDVSTPCPPCSVN